MHYRQTNRSGLNPIAALKVRSSSNTVLIYLPFHTYLLRLYTSWKHRTLTKILSIYFHHLRRPLSRPCNEGFGGSNPLGGFIYSITKSTNREFIKQKNTSNSISLMQWWIQSKFWGSGIDFCFDAAKEESARSAH